MDVRVTNQWQMDNIEYRPGTEEDWKAATALAWRTFYTFDAEFFGEEGRRSFLNFVTGDTLHYFFKLNAYQLYLALENGVMIGMALMRQGKHVSLLFVDGKYHHKGIGSKLLSYAMDKTRERRHDGPVSVNASPYAIDFYKVNGFSPAGEKVYEDGIYYLPMKKVI